jgi:hypothetical protein
MVREYRMLIEMMLIKTFLISQRKLVDTRGTSVYMMVLYT